MFPDNPGDPTASGVRNLGGSLERVRATGAADVMPVQKYDVCCPGARGDQFEERYWSPINTPILGPDGTLAFILHRVEDVTDFVHLQHAGADHARDADELRVRTEQMDTEIYRRSQEVHEVNQQLRAALDDAEKAARMRDEVLRIVSHDLKTPLTTIQGVAQMLAQRVTDGDLEPEHLLTRLQRINDAATRMSTWIDELLDVAQLDAGQELQLYVSRADLTALVQEAAEDQRQAAAEHTIILENTTPRLVGNWDATRLRRVVDNLLANAIKYGPSGSSVRITLARQEDEGGNWALIQVRDQGVGIPASDQPHIFERFRRGSNVTRIAGTGIRLAVTCQIVRQHGGRIDLESEEGRGSTFSMYLPLASAHEQAGTA